MTNDIGPSGPELLEYVRNQIVLHPEKYGVMGSYSMDMLQAQRSEDAMFMFDQLAYRLTTAVLCGRTISEKPEVELSLPASPWHHLKHRFDWWVSDKNELWEGRTTDCNPATPPPWMVLLWPLLVLFPRWLRKHPVKYTVVKAAVEFEQRILYPEIDAPAQCGRPVIYETLDVHYPGIHPPFGSRLVNDPFRFLNRHEIARQVMQDPDGQRYGVSLGPDQTLMWLERHGVNVDQLVRRK
jgi:hypothetical protein